MDVNETILTNQTNELKSNLSYFEKYGQPLVDEYASDLDDKVTAVKLYLQQVRALNLNLDVPSLQRICIDLSSTIYFTKDKVEKLSLLADFSGIKYKDKYNEAYLNKQGSHDAGTKYSVEQLKAFADQEAISEKLINFVYQHAVKILDGKIDAANELLKSCSKALSAEIQSMQVFGVSNKYQQ